MVELDEAFRLSWTGVERDGASAGLSATSDLEHIFAFVGESDRVALSWDGEIHEPFDGGAFEQPRVDSPDGRRIAVLGERGGRVFVIVDGSEFGPYAHLSQQVGIDFSPDGSRFAFGIVDEDRTGRLVVDGTIVEDHLLGATPPVFSADGARLAFMSSVDASSDSKQFVVIDGVPGPTYSGIAEGSFRFSPDGRRHAYAIQDGDGFRIVVDGVPGPAFDGIAEPILFSDDSANLMYRVQHEGREGVAVDHVVDRWHEVAFPVSWSEAGPIIIAKDDDGVAVVVGDTLGPRFDDVFFDPAGRSVAVGGGRVAYLGAHRGKGLLGRRKIASWSLVVDGVPTRDYETVWSAPFLSPDGHVGVIAGSDGGTRIELDGVPGPDAEDLGLPRFTQLGPVYSAHREKFRRNTVVVKDEPGPWLDDLYRAGGTGSPFAVSPDGRHVGFSGPLDGKGQVVLDGETIATYDDVTHTIFRADGRLSFLARRADEVLTVHAAPGG